MNPSYLQPALFGGLVMGVLSALPFVSAGNLCCCLWVVTGGVVAAYFLQQTHDRPITAGDGALVGLLAGIVGAFVRFVLSIPIGIVIGPYERAMLQRMLEVSSSMTPEVRQFIERYVGADGATSLFFLIARNVVELVFWLVVGSMFSALGGVLGAAVLAKPRTGADGEPGAV
jgi:hypothetical protein